MMQEQKTHSPWNALQDHENISIIITHDTTCADKMSNSFTMSNAFFYRSSDKLEVEKFYKGYVRATELFNLN